MAHTMRFLIASMLLVAVCEANIDSYPSIPTKIGVLKTKLKQLPGKLLERKLLLPGKLRKAKSWWSPVEKVEQAVGGLAAEAPLELAPLSQYPVWKVHKYNGIELRPVVLVDKPAAAPGSAVFAPLPDTYGPPGYSLPPLPTVYGEPPRTVQAPAPGQIDPRSTPESTDFKYPEEKQMEEATAEEMPLSDEEMKSSLDTISSLGALLGGSEDGSGHTNIDRLQFLLQIVNSDASLLDRFKNLKNLKYSIGSEIVTPTTPPAPTSAIYFPSPQKGFLHSLLPSFLKSNPTPVAAAPIPLPPLPDVSLSSVDTATALEGVRLPELPAIHLPPYPAAPAAPGPYLRVQYAPLPSYNAPQYQYQPVYDSYGAPLPGDFYAAPSDPEPVAVAAPQQPATADNLDQMQYEDTYDEMQNSDNLQTDNQPSTY